MHPNPAFRQEPRARNLAFARDRAFGILALNGAEGPVMSHVPFLLNDDGTAADLHLVRSTPVARALTEPRAAVIAVSGPDGYVSPDWYDAADQVPTWNYIAVHLRGTLELLPQDDLHGLLDRQSDAYESRLLPKQPWTLDKLPEDARLRLYRQIVPCRLTIVSVDGTWKLNQNKTESARLGAAAEMQHSAFGQETPALAALMPDAPPARQRLSGGEPAHLQPLAPPVTTITVAPLSPGGTDEAAHVPPVALCPQGARPHPRGRPA